MSKPLKVLALAMGDGINLVLNFLLIPILARTFDVETYGTYGQVLMLAGFFVTLLSMGLNNILLRDLSQDENKAEVFYNNLFSGILVGAAGMLVVLIFAPIVGAYFNNPALVSALRFYTPYIPLTIAISSCNAALIFLGKSRSIVVVSVITNLIRLVGIIFISLFLERNLNLIFAFLTILSLGQFLVLWYEVDWKYYFNLVSRSKIGSQIKSALPLGVTVMISSIITIADGFYVSTLLNVEEYALYRNGAMYLPLIMNLYGAINSIILPDVSQLYKNNAWSQIASMKRSIADLFVLIVYPVLIFFLFFARDLVALVFSEKYILSTVIFQIYNLSLFFRICNAEDLFIVANKASRLPYIYAITCIYVLIVNYVFINLWGINGAVLASFSGVILLILLVYYYGFRLIQMKLSEIVPWKNIGRVLLITVPLNILLITGEKYCHHPFYFMMAFFPYILMCYLIFLKLEWMNSTTIRKMVVSVTGQGKLIKAYDSIFG